MIYMGTVRGDFKMSLLQKMDFLRELVSTVFLRELVSTVFFLPNRRKFDNNSATQNGCHVHLFSAAL